MKLSNFKFIGRCKNCEHSVSDDAIEATVDMTTGYLWRKTTTTYHVMCAALGDLAVGRWVVRYRVHAPQLPQLQMYALYHDYADNIKPAYPFTETD